ncbi:hypothetical protein RRG08_046350 [Elysia crispata]|uniref:Uncharacterized protein n=1 Tax=Elysia crispata TaxID=231223 RepID=A0AAE1A5X8_9GAST|nr:hypothetical protein RRG08_046350 [Elysia crispata]
MTSHTKSEMAGHEAMQSILAVREDILDNSTGVLVLAISTCLRQTWCRCLSLPNRSNVVRHPLELCQGCRCAHTLLTVFLLSVLVRQVTSSNGNGARGIDLPESILRTILPNSA